MSRSAKRALDDSKLTRIREQIRNGEYETKEKLEIALIRMMSKVMKELKDEGRPEPH